MEQPPSLSLRGITSREYVSRVALPLGILAALTFSDCNPGAEKGSEVPRDRWYEKSFPLPPPSFSETSPPVPTYASSGKDRWYAENTRVSAPVVADRWYEYGLR